MPQISPISWILIIVMFSIMLMLVKSNFPSISQKQVSPTKTYNKNKMMKW